MLALWLFVCVSIARDMNNDVTRIAFGSCANQNGPQSIFRTIAAEKADVFVFLGDTVYVDRKNGIIPGRFLPASLAQMKESFDFRANQPEFRAIAESGAEMMAMWDDHDYGTLETKPN